MGDADLGEREEEILEGRGRTDITSGQGGQSLSWGSRESRGLGKEALGQMETRKVALQHTDPEGIAEWGGSRQDQDFPWDPILGVCSSLQAQHPVCFSFCWH